MLGGIIITNSASRNIAKCAVSQAARLVSKGSTAALVPQTGQGFATHSGKYPIQPYSKKRVKAKKSKFARPWLTLNDNRLTEKFLRHASRVANELGVTDEVAAFDAAAKAFPNPPPVVAATIIPPYSLLERPNVVIRDFESWEADWIDFKLNKRNKTAKQYPAQLIDMWTASDKVLEKQQEKQKKAAEARAAELEKESAESGNAKSGDTAQLLESDIGLGDFYDRASAATSSGTEERHSGLTVAPRESSADEINDIRSLDRAYTQRLFLLLKDKTTGEWVLPRAEKLDGEYMVQAAERGVRNLFSDPSLQVWYPGRAPIGHWFRVYSPDEQQKKQCYGEKVFIYRAEIMGGRFRMPRTGPAASADPRDPDTFEYSDFSWLSRDESETVLERPFYKYLHQIVGAGAGEEFARRQKWLEKVHKHGLTIDQASGRRNHRIEQDRKTAGRLPAVATRAQAELAAKPFADASKAESLKKAVDEHFDRVRKQKSLHAAISKQLNEVPRIELVRQQLKESRAKRAALMQ